VSPASGVALCAAGPGVTPSVAGLVPVICGCCSRVHRRALWLYVCALLLGRAPSLPGRGAARDAAPLLPVASRTWHPALRLVWSAAPAMPAPYAERGC